MATPITVWIKNDALFLSDPDTVVPAPVPVPTPTPVPAPVPVPTPVPVGRPQFRGCNLTGGSTSYTKWTQSLGPVKGTDYMFLTTADIDRLIAKGMNAFRLLVAWEAMQPTEYATISTTSGNYAAYRDAAYALVTYITGKGKDVLLDIHGDIDAGFAAYRGQKVGTVTASGQKVEDLLENFWWQMATKFKTNTRVHYGITNEPHDIVAATWFTAAQKFVNGIRNAGATSKIVMPGVDWTGAGTWNDHNAGAWNLVDPLNNLAAQVHLYYDQDAGGGVNDIAYDMVGADRLKNVCDWGRKNKVEIWIAETGLAASNPIAAKTWANTLAFVNANKDIFGGLLWWAEGPPAWWGGYRFELFDANGATPNMALFASALVP